MIYWELCKKLKFDHTTKWYMYKQESALKNEMLKLLWDLEIQMDKQISVCRPDFVIVTPPQTPRICRIIDFTVPADHKVKEIEERDKYQDMKEKTKEHLNDGSTNCNRRAGYSQLRIGKGTGGIGNIGSNVDQIDYRIIGLVWFGFFV